MRLLEGHSDEELLAMTEFLEQGRELVERARALGARTGLLTARVVICGFVLACCACGSTAHSPERRLLHVRGAATSLPVTDSCFLLLRTDVVGGGWATYCMKRFINDPAPNTTVLSTGEMTFALPDGTIRARVHINTRFGPDGHRAVQRVSGTIVGGGTITGGGPYDEDPPGHVASSNLRYVIVH